MITYLYTIYYFILFFLLKPKRIENTKIHELNVKMADVSTKIEKTNKDCKTIGDG